MTLREELGKLESLTFPDIVEPQARLLKGVKLLVPTHGEGSETSTRFLVGKDANGSSWIYAYLDEDALRRGTGEGQHYSVFLFDDLVEIAVANDFGGIIIDQHPDGSSALLPRDYFDATLSVLGR